MHEQRQQQQRQREEDEKEENKPNSKSKNNSKNQTNQDKSKNEGERRTRRKCAAALQGHPKTIVRIDRPVYLKNSDLCGGKIGTGAPCNRRAIILSSCVCTVQRACW